jgi:hypothetical protein
MENADEENVQLVPPALVLVPVTVETDIPRRSRLLSPCCQRRAEGSAARRREEGGKLESGISNGSKLGWKPNGLGRGLPHPVGPLPLFGQLRCLLRPRRECC